MNIAVLCSGGDGPGMNACVRAIVRGAIGSGHHVFGIQKGLEGLLQEDFRKMDLSSVGNILQRGGTILQTSRCMAFFEKKHRKRAVSILRQRKIDGLIVIGGDGSFQGAYALWNEHEFPVVGIPGSIDNDISGTDYTIGFYTALETATRAVDQIRDTAHAHGRIFFVEVMGKNSPHLAIHVGICTGAENIVFPHLKVDYPSLIAPIRRGMKRGKQSFIIIVAEGERPGFSYELQAHFKRYYQLESHVCILGHIQRGGSPNSMDRFYASHMGELAIQSLVEGKVPSAMVLRNGRLQSAPLTDCLTKKMTLDETSLQLMKTLAI